MGNRNASVVTRIPDESASDARLACEEPRDFHFAVTWVTLFAHLDLIESAGPYPCPAVQPSTLALVPVVASAPPQPIEQAPGAAWEMVVPKMIRTGPRTFVPAEVGEPT